MRKSEVCSKSINQAMNQSISVDESVLFYRAVSLGLEAHAIVSGVGFAVGSDRIGLDRIGIL